MLLTTLPLHRPWEFKYETFMTISHAVWITKSLLVTETLGTAEVQTHYREQIGITLRSDKGQCSSVHLVEHDDVNKWKHFPRYWPFVRGIHWSSVNSPSQRPVARSFDLYLNRRLSKQSRRRWFETPSRSLWRHCNEITIAFSTFHDVATWFYSAFFKTTIFYFDTRKDNVSKLRLQ